jgi:hypothetical protein
LILEITGQPHINKGHDFGLLLIVNVGRLEVPMLFIAIALKQELWQEWNPNWCDILLMSCGSETGKGIILLCRARTLLLNLHPQPLANHSSFSIKRR